VGLPNLKGGSATQAMLDGKYFLRKPLNIKAVFARGFRNSITCVALPNALLASVVAVGDCSQQFHYQTLFQGGDFHLTC